MSLFTFILLSYMKKLDFSIIIFNKYNSSFPNFTFKDFYGWIIDSYFYRELYDFKLNVTYYLHLINTNNEIIAVIPFTINSHLDEENMIGLCFDLLYNHIVEYIYESWDTDGIILYISKYEESNKINLSDILKKIFVAYEEYWKLK